MNVDVPYKNKFIFHQNVEQNSEYLLNFMINIFASKGAQAKSIIFGPVVLELK